MGRLKTEADLKVILHVRAYTALNHIRKAIEGLQETPTSCLDDRIRLNNTVNTLRGVRMDLHKLLES